jgi:hypothetical protein
MKEAEREREREREREHEAKDFSCKWRTAAIIIMLPTSE